MKRIALLFIVTAFVTGCATIESASRDQIKYISHSSTNYPPLAKDQPVDLFFQDSPAKPYDVIGEINGFVVHDKNIRPMLETRARQVGGNGVIDIQTSNGTVSGPIVFSGNMAIPTDQRAIDIKAKIIRYK